MLRAAPARGLRPHRGGGRGAGRGGGEERGQRRKRQRKGFIFSSFVRRLRLQVQAHAKHAFGEEREHLHEDDRGLGDGRGRRVSHGSRNLFFFLKNSFFSFFRVFFLTSQRKKNFNKKNDRSAPTPRRSCRASPSPCGVARARRTSMGPWGSTPPPRRSL